MSGSAPTNNSAVQFEQQQAAEADQKEAARQASLQQGQDLINQIFSGTPVTTPQAYDWSTFKAPQVMPAVMSQWLAKNPGTAAPDFSQTGSAPAGYTATQGGVKDASGKFYAQGTPLTVQTPTGATTGGFDDAFYNKYKQQVLDYYQPDEQRQYQEAQRDLTYNLARAGTLQSSTAGDKQGDLAYNDALQKANIVANANAQTGQLQNQIQSNKQDLINQLYATDDPTLTANLAESSAKASQLQNPTLTPAASLFTPIAVGSTTALSGLGYGASPYASPYTQPPASPTPAASNASSGKTINYQ